MPSESGYSNKKKIGEVAHKTLHNLGSSRVGQHVVQKSLAARSETPEVIEAVALSRDPRLQHIRITKTGHGAKVNDVIRFMTGNLSGAELEVVDVIDANNFIIINVVGLPSIGDTYKVLYYVTPKSDAEGNLNFSPGPTQYLRDGVATSVEEDTANPANNRALPSVPMFYKDGVLVPVLEDTVTPANNEPLPVKLTGVTGDVIINAGDLNVSTVSTNDSMALGDSVTGDKATVDVNGTSGLGELHVRDDDANQKLGDIETAVQSLDGKDFATETTLATLGTEATLDDVKTAVESIALEDFATETTLDAVKDAVELIDNVVNVDGNPSGTSGVLIGGIDSNGDFQAVTVNPAGELQVNFGSAGFATETTLAALSAKVANDFGASSGAVRTAAQIGNASGAADFNSGADSAQTLRVSANLKRAGNELSYNSGAADANTLRTVLATRHEIATTPLAAHLSDGVNFITSQAIAAAQTTVSTIVKTLTTFAIMAGWDGTTHRELAVDTSGNLKTSPRVLSSTIGQLATSGTLSAPVGAKGYVIQNSTRAEGGLRYKGVSGASASVGFLLEPGQSTSYQDGASDISVHDVDGLGIDCTVLWYV